MRIGTTAAVVLCGSLYLYVVCIVREGWNAVPICASVLYSHPSSIYVLTLTPPSGVLAKKKNLHGKTNLASIPDDRYNKVVLVYE